MSTEAYAVKYFLDRPPASFDRAALPALAKDFIIAKVRITEAPAYLVGRDQSGEPPALPKDLFAVGVEILSTLEGSAVSGAKYQLRFGVPGLGRNIIYPHTPRQKAGEYFIASYVDEDRLRRLVAFPASQPEYDAWEQEVSAYERERARPGR